MASLAKAFNLLAIHCETKLILTRIAYCVTGQNAVGNTHANTPLQYFWIGLGGFLGANARYLIQQWAASVWGADFPYGTMMANVSGSLLIAFFLTVAAERLPTSPEVRLFVAVGFLGGFTTFSSFSLETYRLLMQRGWLMASLNFFGNTVLGFVGVLLGVLLARLSTE